MGLRPASAGTRGVAAGLRLGVLISGRSFPDIKASTNDSAPHYTPYICDLSTHETQITHDTVVEFTPRCVAECEKRVRRVTH